MNNTPTTYSICDASGQYRSIESDELILTAQRCIQERFSKGEALTSPKAAAHLCQVLLAPEQQEVFYALWLNSQHEVIHHGELSRGTLDSASVYPREVVKTALPVTPPPLSLPTIIPVAILSLHRPISISPENCATP